MAGVVDAVEAKKELASIGPLSLFITTSFPQF